METKTVSQKSEKTCPQCGKKFTTGRKNKKFCSDACRLKSYASNKGEPFIFVIAMTQQKKGFFRRILSYIW